MILEIALVTILILCFIVLLISKPDGNYLEDDVKREEMWRKYEKNKES